MIASICKVRPEKPTYMHIFYTKIASAAFPGRSVQKRSAGMRWPGRHGVAQGFETILAGAPTRSSAGHIFCGAGKSGLPLPHLFKCRRQPLFEACRNGWIGQQANLERRIALEVGRGQRTNGLREVVEQFLSRFLVL